MKPLALLSNLLLLYGLYFVCAVIFVAENWGLYAPGWTMNEIGTLLCGFLLFTTSAICYTNAPYIFLFLLPIPSLSAKRWYQMLCKWLFVTVNALAVVANLSDAVYSKYTGRRTTSSLFSEFADDGNIGSIIGVELLHHWYLLLIGILLIASLWFLYRKEKSAPRHPFASLAALLILIPLSIIGMRGGASYHRPISTADASRFVTRPQDANIVLNTPFSIIRTIGKATFSTPQYYSDTQLDNLFSPIHQPHHPLTPHPNVVIIVLESFGSEYVGAGYTPFLDSLMAVSLTFDNSFANGRKSIDALPSILSSIPMFVEPFVLTRYASNKTSSIASELQLLGYRSAFFHGADNQSMGFQSYVRSVGFQDYYGMDEYCLDPRFHGTNDFDGYWAIWDEEFLQYFAQTMDTIPQPFLTTVFTATSHHPFNIPQRYQSTFKGGDQPICRTIQYSDHALRQFFATASQMPWYSNTLFVITADHTNSPVAPEYQSPIGLFRVPIILFDPSHHLPVGTNNTPAQQIDIMPTLLDLIGAQRPYLAFGKNLLTTPQDQAWIVNYNNGLYQYLQNDTLTLFDGTNIHSRYHYSKDPCLTSPLPPHPSDSNSLRHLKALIQSYMQRMIDNRLTE